MNMAGNTIVNLSKNEESLESREVILILGAGMVCRPAVHFLVTKGNELLRNWWEISQDDSGKVGTIHVIVASLFLQDAEAVVKHIPNTTALQIDATDHDSLSMYISHPQAKVLLCFLPPNFDAVVAELCIQHKKHLVTANYVDYLSSLDSLAKSTGIAILGEMGLDPGIDHMLAMKMIDEVRTRNGTITAFSSYCGGLPSPSAANNPLAYKFSWNPAGAIQIVQTPATYKHLGEIVHVDGFKLCDSAKDIEIPDHLGLALEYFPNRSSLPYGDLYGIEKEALTILRATLRYKGFSRTMGSLSKLGFFNNEVHPLLKEERRPTFGAFLNELLKIEGNGLVGSTGFLESPSQEEEMINRMVFLGHCNDRDGALKTLDTIKFLGLHSHREIPQACASALDVLSLCMEEKLIYSGTEKDMVLLHHEIAAVFPDGHSEKLQATLLEFGRIEDGKLIGAMALTVGIPAATGVMLLLADKIKTRGVMRPLDPELYIPALKVIEAAGIKVVEKVERY